MERVLDEISFAATDRSGETVKIDAAYVQQARRRSRQERRSEPVYPVALHSCRTAYPSLGPTGGADLAIRHSGARRAARD